MARWRIHKNDHIANSVKVRIAKKLASVEERDDDWVAFASNMCGLLEDDLRDNIALGGNSVLLATLIDFSRRAIQTLDWDLLNHVKALTQFDIHHTLPGLQHDFCVLWNELVRGVRMQGSSVFFYFDIIRWVRHHYIALHQDTEGIMAGFPPSMSRTEVILPWLILLCDIASHYPESTLHNPLSNSRVPLQVPTQPSQSPDASHHHSASDGSTISQEVKEATIIAEPPPPSIRRHLAKSKTPLRPLQPPQPPHHFTPPLIPQMCHHQVL
jgi:hypothetical protein